MIIHRLGYRAGTKPVASSAKRVLHSPRLASGDADEMQCPSFEDYNVGDKRSLTDGTVSERGSRRLIASDIDASNLLLNFFKATRDMSDSNDSDSSESNELNGNISSGSTSISGRTTYYDSSGTNGSGSDDQDGDSKSPADPTLFPF